MNFRKNSKTKHIILFLNLTLDIAILNSAMFKAFSTSPLFILKSSSILAESKTFNNKLLNSFLVVTLSDFKTLMNK